MRIGIQRREPACCDSLSLQLRTKNTIPTPRNPFRTLPRFVRAGSGKPRKNTVGERSPQRPGPVPFAAWNFRAIAKALRLSLSDHVAGPADRSRDLARRLCFLRRLRLSTVCRKPSLPERPARNLHRCSEARRFRCERNKLRSARVTSSTRIARMRKLLNQRQFFGVLKGHRHRPPPPGTNPETSCEVVRWRELSHPHLCNAPRRPSGLPSEPRGRRENLSAMEGCRDGPPCPKNLDSAAKRVS